MVHLRHSHTRVVAEKLLLQKKPVRVLVRTADKGEEWKKRGAEVAVLELDDAAVVELSGPRDYSPKDVAAALSRITGKTVRAEQGPEEAIVPAFTGAGLNAHWAGLYRDMIHGVNTGLVDFEQGKAQGIRGSTEIEAVLKGLVG